MSDTPIEKMNLKQLRNEVQFLRDELAVFKRKYEDMIYNLDNDNFSGRIIKEKDDMRAELKVTAEEISTKVSNEQFSSAMSQTADKISTIVYEYIDTSQAVEVDSPDDFKDKSKVYVIEGVFYHYNSISEKWNIVKDGETINSLFKQTSDGFELNGDVKVDGSCILTESLTFNSEDRPVQVEYSANGAGGWHEGFVSGTDKFMRIKIGAEWSDAMKVVGDGSGGSADVTPRAIFDVLTSGGTEQGLFSAFHDGGDKLYINAEYIRAGTLSGMQIENPGGDIRMVLEDPDTTGPDHGVFRLYDLSHGSTKFFSVYYDDLGTITLDSAGGAFLQNSSGITYPKGAWDFSSCGNIYACFG